MTILGTFIDIPAQTCEKYILRAPASESDIVILFVSLLFDLKINIP